MMAVERRPDLRRPRRRRKPDAVRYEAAAFQLPEQKVREPMGLASLTASLVAAGIIAGVLWPQQSAEKAPEDDIFVMEEEIPPPPPEPPPPPPMPEPPPPPKAVEPEPPPPPQFGLEEGDLSEAGDMAVATGNTIMKEAEPVVAPPPPPLPPAPVFVDVAPRILKGDPPGYPERAQDRGLEGEVVAIITIDTSGLVTKVTIEKSAGPDFDESVRQAVRKNVFQARVQNGRKVPAIFRAPFEFRLE